MMPKRADGSQTARDARGRKNHLSGGNGIGLRIGKNQRGTSKKKPGTKKRGSKFI